MLDAAPPVWPTDAPISPEASSALTPEAIELALSNFRDWLGHLADVEEPEQEPRGVDFSDIVGEFTALRHEVKLQTRATRQVVEQNGEALRQLGVSVEALNGIPKDDPALKVLLKGMLDVYDNLALALKQVEKQRLTLEGTLGDLESGTHLPEPPDIAALGSELISERPRGFWSRMFGATPVPEKFAEAVGRQVMIDWRDQVLKETQLRGDRTNEVIAIVRSNIESLISGYRMSLNRVDRALAQIGVEPLVAMGNQFDPELMEAVEVVPDAAVPSGEVAEELRRGYRWRGQILRFAQVKVAR